MPEPSVNCGRAFAAVAVERAVGPAAQEGADEAFGSAVGRGRRFVLEHLGVGQVGAIVNRDVHALAAGEAASDAESILSAAAGASLAGETTSRSVLDPS